ncbi:hypothetical protein Tco_1215756 [Tanacetum coccineum]
METTPVHTLNLARVQTESKRIIESSYTHFITLSLFFLPLSVSLVTGPSFRISPYNFTVDHLHKLDQKRIIYHLLYVLIGYVFALCAIASITCSTHHGFLDSLHEFNSWVYVFFTMLSSSYLVWLLLQITIANTVLYNYCKELRGELATGSAEGFAHKYINLLASDEKVPCVATVTTA